MQQHQKSTSTIRLEEIPMDRQSNSEGISESKRSKAEVVVLTLISSLTGILLCHGMFTIYNSLSNLGVLNLQSWLLMLVIDQVAIRPAVFLIWFSFVKGLDLCGVLPVGSPEGQETDEERIANRNKTQDGN